MSSFLTTTANAQGDLLVMPKRIVFDGSKRSEDLNLANIGKDSATYVISLVQIRMKEDGTFEKITEPDSAQFFADKNIRFFPRTVTLAPNEAQTVKVQVIKTNQLEPGEYRSHIYFRAIPREKPLGEVEPPKDSSISVNLIPIFGITIAAIIRQGESTAKVSLSDVAVVAENNAKPLLKMTFNRTGNMSVYGDVSIDHISPKGKVTRVGIVKGMAVYTPNTIRKFNIFLDDTLGVNYHSGKLQIVYADQSPKALPLTAAEVNLSNTQGASVTVK